MNAIWRHALAVAGLAIATQAAAQITFYEHSRFRGRSFTADRPIGNLERFGLNDEASSAVVSGEPWEVCDGAGFSGRCVVLRPGRYESLGAMGMNDMVSSVRPASSRDAPVAAAPPPVAAPPPSGAQITFYERHDFRGRSFTSDRPIGNLERFGFNDRASSAVVSGDSWEVCDGPRFSGRCAVLRPGQYPSLDAMGLNNTVSSARAASREAPVPAPSGAQITFYERHGFHGRSFTADRPIGNLERFGFNDRASSAVVSGEPWEVCDGPGFSGQCAVLRPGQYPSLNAMGLNNSVSSARAVSREAPRPGPAPSVGQVTFYEHPGFQGRSFTADRQVWNLERFGYNDRASSAEVAGEPWEVCDATGFNGRCVVLRPGRYPSLGAMGLNDSVSSTRPASRR